MSRGLFAFLLLSWVIGGYVFILFVPYGSFKYARYAKKRGRWLKGLCTECGYDMQASPVCCPECGADKMTAKQLNAMDPFEK